MSSKVYRIENDPVCGRQLVAARHITAGELIIDEPALVTGPGFDFSDQNSVKENGLSQDHRFLTCLVCCSKLSYNHFQCPICGLLLCSEVCQRHPQHSENECVVFPKLGRIWDENRKRSTKSLYNLILVIRALFYKFRSPIQWDQVQMLESKSEALEKVGAFSELQDVFSSLRWDMFSSSITPPETNGSDNNHSNIMSAAQHCLGVLRINAFSSFTESYSREGLYFLSSLMSHSCVINTDRQMEGGGLSGARMVVRASVDIEKDGPITTTYLSLLYNTEERHRLMISTWLFVCRCKRCESPTECGANSSAILCKDKLTTFSCREGKGCESADRLSDLICDDNHDSCKTEALTEIQDVVRNRPKTLENIEQLEAWLDQFDTGILHPNHSVFAHVKLFLSQFYGRRTGLDSFTVDQLKRKVLYCWQLLSIYNIVCPGIQMCRGVICFELWCALRKLSEEWALPVLINYPLLTVPENRKIAPNKLLTLRFEFKDIQTMKEEALNVLKYALPNSAEESMVFILREEECSAERQESILAE